MFVNFMLAGAASYYIGSFIASNASYQGAVGKLPPMIQKVAPAALAGLVLFGIHKSGALQAVSKGAI